MPNPVKATFDVVSQKFPVGTTAVGFLLTLVNQAEGANVTATAGLDATEITVADVPVGTYLGNIALVDASGAPVAPAAFDPAVLTMAVAADVSFPVPTSLTLTRP